MYRCTCNKTLIADSWFLILDSWFLIPDSCLQSTCGRPVTTTGTWSSACRRRGSSAWRRGSSAWRQRRGSSAWWRPRGTPSVPCVCTSSSPTGRTCGRRGRGRRTSGATAGRRRPSSTAVRLSPSAPPPPLTLCLRFWRWSIACLSDSHHNCSEAYSCLPAPACGQTGWQTFSVLYKTTPSVFRLPAGHPVRQDVRPPAHVCLQDHTAVSDRRGGVRVGRWLHGSSTCGQSRRNIQLCCR